MCSDNLWGVFRASSDSHRKISDHSVCNIAGLTQTSENVGILDVSDTSVLAVLYVAVIHLARRIMS